MTTTIDQNLKVAPPGQKSALYSERASFQYIPALDGFRAIAILLVMFSHFGFGEVVPGGLGVTLFFFISGLLITRLLIAEHNRSGSISISRFYVRRALRLGPGLVTVVSLVLVLQLVLGAPINWPLTAAALFYYMNYYLLLGGALTMPLGIFWSLAVEEHYYLFYPQFFSRCWRNPRLFLAALTAFSLAILMWRLCLTFWLHASSDHNYIATDARIDSILYGAILAVGLEIEPINGWIRRSAGTVGFALAVVALLLTLLYRSPDFRDTVRYTIQGLAFIPLFYAILFGEQFKRIRNLIEIEPLVWIGRISYSLYLWHFVVLYAVRAIFVNAQMTIHYAIAWAATFGMASLSYYLVETPFLRFRKTFRSATRV